MTFKGLSVLVTGGSRGIAREIARNFAELGAARVAIVYLRNDRAAEKAAEEVRRLGTEPILVRGNVASERIAQQVEELGPLDVLVHNAATGVIEPALETEDKHFDWTFAACRRARSRRPFAGKRRRARGVGRAGRRTYTCRTGEARASRIKGQRVRAVRRS